MPQINLIPEVLYEPNQPYHYLYDNIPLRNILARISLVNIQADKNATMLLGTAGTAGSIANRLDESLNEDGSLRAASIDESMHNIAYHADGTDDAGVEYVRMTGVERSKLSLVESGANLLTIQVGEEGPIESGNVELRSSATIFFDLEAPNVVRAHSSFPPDVAHRHVYDVEPAHQSLGYSSSSSSSGPDWRNFKTTLLGTAYVEGSLRVYINGVRIGSGVRVPVFSGSSTPSSWVLFSVSSESPEEGKFSLNTAVPIPNNNIRIDFDMVVPSVNPFPSSSSSSSSSSPSS
jgi:hypothetical protein